MQAAAGSRAGSGNVAGVHGDLRLYKNDIQHGLRRLDPGFLSVDIVWILLQEIGKFNKKEQ